MTTETADHYSYRRRQEDPGRTPSHSLNGRPNSLSGPIRPALLCACCCEPKLARTCLPPPPRLPSCQNILFSAGGCGRGDCLPPTGRRSWPSEGTESSATSTSCPSPTCLRPSTRFFSERRRRRRAPTPTPPKTRSTPDIMRGSNVLQSRRRWNCSEQLPVGPTAAPSRLARGTSNTAVVPR